MNWANVMNEIKADLDRFVNDGGWSFLHDD